MERHSGGQVDYGRRPYHQVAEILWRLTCHGGLRRLYDWVRRTTEQGLARALWEGLRACRFPPDLPPLGQLRFNSA